ncbi:MAG TPA: TRIC cation channel family protein [Tepidisphaeraceae bacterium]|nr:TRIC cation channel family protein [Tepidisphaeraceae bacterium]
MVLASWSCPSRRHILRDLLIGAVPPGAISDGRYLAAAIATGVLTFYGYSMVDRLSSPVLLFDAAGLALFAVTGTQKALAFDLSPVMAALMGMVTGIGGGVVRDVLLSDIPTVLQTDLYAVAALAGAAIVAIGHVLHLPSAATVTAGALRCFGLRFMAIRRGWHLPSAPPQEQSSEAVTGAKPPARV